MPIQSTKTYVYESINSDACLIQNLKWRLEFEETYFSFPVKSVLSKRLSVQTFYGNVLLFSCSVTNVLVSMLDGLTPSGLSVVTRKKSGK